MTHRSASRSLVRSALALMGAVALTAGLAAPASATGLPDTIVLPGSLVAGDEGFQPEGIAVRGSTAYAGSLVDGTIVRADLRTGQVRRLVRADGDPAAGLAVTKRLLVVAGGDSGELRVYERRTGKQLRVVKVPGARFVNDVTVAGGVAYFTESRADVLYALSLRAGTVRTIRLGGDFRLAPGADALNGNGVVALSRHRVILGQTTDPDGTGSALYRVDVRTGTAKRIAVRGGDVENADGLVLRGRTLFVVQNRSNSVATLRLSDRATTATVRSEITDDRFQVPSTAALGPRGGLYLVNAEFGTPPSDAVTSEIVRVPAKH